MATANLSSARAAIVSEINFLKSEQARLTKVLEMLGGSTPAASSAPSSESAAAPAGKRRGRKPKANKVKSSSADLGKALELIKGAGKGGIKAIKLAFEMKKSGNTPVGKFPLLESGKVKMSGTGGGTTYAYTG